MKHVILPAAVAAFMAVSALPPKLANAQAVSQASGVPVKPITTLSWLVGGVWIADASKFGNGMQRIETRYRWSDNGSYIRFTTHFITDKAELKTYDGHFFWSPAKKTLELWYMDASNAITEGPVTWDGDLMQVVFRGPDFQGTVADLRVDVLRKTNDLYHWSVSEKQGELWKELGSFDYVRKPDL
jgi:hypothetical protein